MNTRTPSSAKSLFTGANPASATHVLVTLLLLFLLRAMPALADNNGGQAHGFNRPGNILIADQFNNRVIEVDPGGHILWSFGRGPNDFSTHSIIGCNDAKRVGILTLMAGTGT